MDLRKSLITVRSCEEHNTVKSKDDEYLRLMLVMNAANNVTARAHFGNKVMSGITRRPALMNQLLEQQVAVYIQDLDADTTEKTIAVPVDMPRLDRCFELMGNALYFFHFKRHWTGTVKTIPHFIVGLDAEDRNGNDFSRQVECVVDQAVANSEQLGENPEVFSYRYRENPEPACAVVMALNFYEGSKVTILFEKAAQTIPG
ncbi:hypothetical protein [Caballeronia sordidicola]|uniref:hypothetical protein n=1 Tax=Caballeronia sordidicola TaxID=196367 RepID=UPI0004D026F7|nr:hypothetical protein [Caballeronia sordidicola]